MKLTLSRESLLEQLNCVIGAVEKKSTTPILENILLKITLDTMTLVTTDLEIEMLTTVPIVADEAGEITVSAKMLYSIVKALLPENDINLTLTENKHLLLRSGRSRFELATLDAEEFPLLDDISISQTLSVPENELHLLLSKVAFAMANQDVRYYLNGLLLDITNDKITAVATDGHRLTTSYLENSQTLETPIQNQKLIIPRKGVLELIRLLNPKSERETILQFGRNHIRIIVDNTRFTSKLIDGRYPEYEGVLPLAGQNILQVEQQAFKNTLSRVAILSNEQFRSISLSISKDLLKVNAKTKGQQTADEELDVDYKGNNIDIAFNVTYLLEAVNHLDGNIAQLDLTDGETGVLLTSPDDIATRYVIMPIRL